MSILSIDIGIVNNGIIIINEKKKCIFSKVFNFKGKTRFEIYENIIKKYDLIDKIKNFSGIVLIEVQPPKSTQHDIYGFQVAYFLLKGNKVLPSPAAPKYRKCAKDLGVEKYNPKHKKKYCKQMVEKIGKISNKNQHLCDAYIQAYYY